MFENAIQNKYDFVVLFDAKNSNPNGDPDAGNMPRTDPISGHGLVTDVCIKRKIRDYIALVHGDKEGFKNYIQSGFTLNEKDEEAFKSLGIDSKDIAEYKKGHPDVDYVLRDFMAANYFDIRAFGGVFTKFATAKLSTASIRGPVQLSFAESISPVEPTRVSITRTTVATENEAKKGPSTMGEKFIIPYGLFKFTGSISAALAQRFTGFSEADLEFFWNAVENMFEFDKSAARPEMVLRKLFIFKHESEYGNAPSHKLYDLIKITEKDGVNGSPRCYEDYTVDCDSSKLPEGTSLICRG